MFLCVAVGRGAPHAFFVFKVIKIIEAYPVCAKKMEKKPDNCQMATKVVQCYGLL